MLRFTRLLLAAGVALTAPTGLGLFVRANETEDFWAWTIRSPLTASFLGSCFLAAAVALGLACRARSWEEARPTAVVAMLLTSLSLVATLVHFDELRLHDGEALPRLVAWTWLAVYVALPPLVVTAFVLEERRLPAAPPRAGGPGRASVAALVAIGGALLVLGVSLMAEWDGLRRAWPWPLPGFASSILGAWLVTFGAGLLWVALRERRSGAVWTGGVALLVLLDLQLLAAVLHDDAFDGEWLWPFAAIVALLAGAVAAIATRERRRGRGAVGR